MTQNDRRLVKAAEYRRLGDLAMALADDSPLEHVREKHILSAARWIELAERDEHAIAAAQIGR